MILHKVAFDSGSGVYPGGNVDLKESVEKIFVNKDLVTHVLETFDKRKQVYYIVSMASAVAFYSLENPLSEKAQ